MRVHLRGHGGSGEPIEREVDMPDDLDLGDSFLYGSEEDRERLQIVALRQVFDAEKGTEHTVMTVEPQTAPQS